MARRKQFQFGGKEEDHDDFPEIPKEICERCMCTLHKSPCVFCVNSGYDCQGSCWCCTLSRKRVSTRRRRASRVAILTPDSSSSDSTQESSSPSAIQKTRSIPIVGQAAENPNENNGSRPIAESLTGASTSRNDGGSRPIAESLAGASTSRNDGNCIMCKCTFGNEPCVVCVDMRCCDGTCSCCELHRALQAIQNRRNNGSRPIAEPLMGASSSRNDDNCFRCMCTSGNERCIVCVAMKFRCDGTCSCCDLHRNIQAKQINRAVADPPREESSDNIPRNSKRSADPSTDSFTGCNLCYCFKGEPCRICTANFFRCTGTCFCCRRFRRKRRKF